MISHPIKGKTLLLFDVDGTLTDCTIPGQPCPNRENEWVWRPNVLETMQLYKDVRDLRTAWISNQGGIELGYMTESDYFRIMVSMEKDWRLYVEYYWCPHAPNTGCACRKPSPFMLLRACVDLSTPLAEAVFIGDYMTNELAAQRAGIEFIWASDFFDPKEMP